MHPWIEASIKSLEWLQRLVGSKTKWGKAVTRLATATWRRASGQLGR